MQDTPRLLTEDQVAEMLNCTPGTLRNWRSLGKGPQWVANPDHGRFMGYRPDAIDAWLAKGEVTVA